MSTKIAVIYALYEKVSGSPPTYTPVTSTSDLELEAELAASDTNKLVTQVAGVDEQTELLLEHVEGVPFDLPVAGHSIDFGSHAPSRWGGSGGWLDVVQGASVYYPVEPTGGATGRLKLEVRTADAVGE